MLVACKEGKCERGELWAEPAMGEHCKLPGRACDLECDRDQRRCDSGDSEQQAQRSLPEKRLKKSMRKATEDSVQGKPNKLKRRAAGYSLS